MHDFFLQRIAIALLLAMAISSCTRESDATPSELQNAVDAANAATQAAALDVIEGRSAMTEYRSSDNPDRDELSEKEILALRGNVEAADELAFMMGTRQAYWEDIAWENGSKRVYAGKILGLMGDDSRNCYRAAHFAQKAISDNAQPLEQFRRYAESLAKQESESGFSCGCSLSPKPSPKIVNCKRRSPGQA